VGGSQRSAVDVPKVAEANVGHDVISLTTVPIPPKGKTFNTVHFAVILKGCSVSSSLEAMATGCSVFYVWREERKGELVMPVVIILCSRLVVWLAI
jgi:hypothetical protein